MASNTSKLNTSHFETGMKSSQNHLQHKSLVSWTMAGMTEKILEKKKLGQCGEECNGYGEMYLQHLLLLCPNLFDMCENEELSS